MGIISAGGEREVRTGGGARHTTVMIYHHRRDCSTIPALLRRKDNITLPTLSTEIPHFTQSFEDRYANYLGFNLIKLVMSEYGLQIFKLRYHNQK